MPPDLPRPLQLGYLVPQFPGQTHIFFWRELAELERLGVTPHLLSTRLPPEGLMSHDWSQAAVARTTYLGRMAPVAALSGALRAPWREILREGEGRAFLRDVAICLPAARALIALARRRGIGHVHAHSCGRAALICALARRMGGPRYSLTLHGALAGYGPGQGFKWRHASFGTVVSRALLDELRGAVGRNLPAEVLVRPMGVDTEEFTRETPYAPPAPGAALRLFSCGRLNWMKGHQDVLAALRLLLDRGIEVRLDIAGEDDEGGVGFRAELQDRIAALGLEGHARLLGAVGAAEVRRHLLAADVFVLASLQEAIGVAYMEAMACGVPTIGTDVGGVHELIDHGESGLLVAPEAPEALADAIAALAADPELCARLSQAGRARVERDFRASLGAEALAGAVRRAASQPS